MRDLAILASLFLFIGVAGFSINPEGEAKEQSYRLSAPIDYGQPQVYITNASLMGELSNQ